MKTVKTKSSENKIKTIFSIFFVITLRSRTKPQKNYKEDTHTSSNKTGKVSTKKLIDLDLLTI